MALTLTPEDYSYIRRLRELKILEEIKPEKINDTKEAILVTCPDARRFRDIEGHQSALHGCEDRAEYKIHPLGWHGGAARLDPHTPMNARLHHNAGCSPSDVFLSELAIAIEVTGIYLIEAFVHAPCGMAYRHHIAFRDLVTSFGRGMMIAGGLAGKNKLISLVHVCYGDLEPGGMKSYFLHLPRAMEVV